MAVVGDRPAAVHVQRHAVREPWRCQRSGAPGLSYANARWYDPVTGNFISQDPLGFGGGDTNLNRFVGNSPTNAMDPTGTTSYTFSNRGKGWRGPSAAQNRQDAAEYGYYLTHPGKIDRDLQDWRGFPFKRASAGDGLSVGIMANGSASGGTPVSSGFGSSPWLNAWSNWVVDNVYGGGTAAAAFGNSIIADEPTAANRLRATQNPLGNLVAAALDFAVNGDTGSLASAAFNAAMGADNSGDATPTSPSPPGDSAQPTDCGYFPTCFVAGTPVIVPGDEKDEIIALSSTISPDGQKGLGNDWFYAATAILVGVAGQPIDKPRKKKRNEEDDFMAKIFGDDPDPKELGFWDIETANACLPADDLDLLARNRVATRMVDLRELGQPAPDLTASANKAAGQATALVEQPTNSRSVVGRFDALEAHGVPKALHYNFCPARRSKAATGSQSAKARVACRVADDRRVFRGPRMWGLNSSQPPSATIASVASVAPPTSRAATRAIEAIHVGQRVVAGNPDYRGQANTSETMVDPALWRLLRLHAEDRWANGTLDTIEVETLQPQASIEANRVSVGQMVPLPLDLIEMGMPPTLRAKVVAIEPCPPIAKGPGRVVLTTVNHLNPYVFELQLVDGKGHAEPFARPASTSSIVPIDGDG